MKNKIFKVSVLLLSILGLTIYSCKKSNLELDPNINNSNIETSSYQNNQRKNCNDGEVNQIINDQTLTASEKTSALIEYDELSSNAVSSIVNNSSSFGKFNLELIFQVCQIKDVDLILFANHSYFDDATLSNIIAAQLPVSTGVEAIIKTHRPNINMSELNKLKNYDRVLSLCDLKMIYAPKSYVIYECKGKSIKFLNPVFRSFVNTATSSDIDVVSRVKDKDKSEWTLGAKSQSSTTDPDGTTVHTISCSTPPNTKCMKIVKQASAERTVDDNTLIDVINNMSLDDYEKGAALTSQDIQSPVMTELINKFCTFDKYVFELITTSNKTMDEDNINRMILNSDIADNLLTNILISSTPLKATSISLLRVVRPNLKAEFFAKYNTKAKIISICNTNITVGDNLIKTNPTPNSTQIKIDNAEGFNFVYQPDPVKIDLIRKKKKGDTKDTWVYGEQSYQSTVGNTTTLSCVEPPSPKCCLVKTADPK